MAEDGSGRSWIGAVVTVLVLAAGGGYWYLRESGHASGRGQAACMAVEAYLRSIAQHHPEAAWRAATPGRRTATSRAELEAAWRTLMRGHGRVTSIAVVEREADVDYARVTVRATLGTTDAHFAPQLDVVTLRGDDGTMRVDSACLVSEAACAPGAW